MEDDRIVEVVDVESDEAVPKVTDYFNTISRLASQ
jgi:hypothetical protein